MLMQIYFKTIFATVSVVFVDFSSEMQFCQISPASPPLPLMCLLALAL